MLCNKFYVKFFVSTQVSAPVGDFVAPVTVLPCNPPQIGATGLPDGKSIEATNPVQPNYIYIIYLSSDNFLFKDKKEKDEISAPIHRYK